MDKIGKEETKELVRNCLAGDKDAWEDLISQLIAVGLSVCGKWRLSSEESLDVIWECNYHLLINLKNLKQPDKIFSYYHTMIINEIKKLLRGQKRDMNCEVKIRETLYDTNPGSPHDILENKMRDETILEAMGELPERCIKLLHFLFLEEFEPTYEEIAAKLKIPISSIGPTRRRCLDKLRRILLDRGFRF